MSVFNEDMPLDEYYNKCVLPKPNIPPSYPGVMGNNKRKNGQARRYFSNKDPNNAKGKSNRQARRLFSYKDHDRSDDNDDDDDDDDNEPDNTDIKDMDTTEYQDTNLNQINYEMNNFNEMFNSEKWLIQVDNVNRQAETFPQRNAIQDTPAGSAQWRIQPNNVNRPAGAPPLVPSNARPNSNITSRFNNKDHSSLGFRQQWKEKQQQQQQHYQQVRKIQNRLGPQRLRPSHQQQQHLLQHNIRNAYNAFSSPGQGNSSMPICETQSKSLGVLQNINNHFPNNYSNNINNEFQKFTDSNTIGSLIDTVSNIPNKCLQSNAVGGNEPVINLKEELLLGDLVKLDSTSFQDINVQEVASNVLLLLQNVVHKPVHDHQVQQEINFLQHTSGIREPGNGIDVAIQPQATHQRMYHRFK